jgi:hypothetical protein
VERLGGVCRARLGPRTPALSTRARFSGPPVRAALVAALLSGLLPAGVARPATPEPDAAAFLDRLQAAWQTRDLPAWLALWDFADAGAKRSEEELVRGSFASDETVLTFVRRPSPAEGATKFDADVQVFEAKEPQARVAFWRFHAEKRAGTWTLVAREDSGALDGLVHLSLGPSAWRTRGVTLHLEDFDLQMEDGTLFSTPEKVGPTAVVFVGRGRVRFSPAPAAEGEQLRQFSGTSSMDREVGWAFVRVDPDEFQGVIDSARLVPETASAARRQQAERIWRDRVERSFMIDAPLPRSPWWLLPSPGDAVVDFPWGKHVLTFALSSGEAEDVNLFDRDRRLQICSYPSGGKPARYSEDDRRAVDVLENTITARFEPERRELEAAHTMRVRLLGPAATLRLRLDDDFRVRSVTAGDGRSLLFFRVRGQSNLVVSLGPFAAGSQPFTLTTRYGGRHDPLPVDQEALQASMPDAVHMADDTALVQDPPIVYSNRTAWYPRPTGEDFATLRAGFDTPEGWLAITGGELVSTHTEGGRTRAEYRLDEPGKFVTAVVGRLSDVGLRQEGAQAVRGYAAPRTRGETLAQMQVLQQMLAFYAERFGPSPYPMVGLVVCEAEKPGGHSPPGLVYLQERPPVLGARSLPDDPANFSDLPGFFLAHEAAHQWWGQGVAPANYRERWLSEAWAQYAAALWLREKLGEDAFRSMMDRMARWALADDHRGPIHLGQRLGHLTKDSRIYRAVVYDKGAWVLHMLRGLVGDEAFFAGARAFLQRFRYGKAGADDLRTALETASGRDLRPYFESWIYGTGLPTLVWSASTDKAPGGFRTTVEVRPDGLPGPLPLEVELTWKGGRDARKFVLEPSGSSWTIDTAQKPEVSVNRNRGLLARMSHRSFPSLSGATE